MIKFWWIYDRHMRCWHAFYSNNPSASLCLIVEDAHPHYWYVGTAPPEKANGVMCPICAAVVTQKIVEHETVV